MTQQHMDPDWLVFHPNPKKPDFQLPKGAVDAHCHVFGPLPEFPFAPERKYTPCNAGKEKLFELRDHLGFTRNVIVQATCHGKDNRAMMDACRASGGLARGVASVGADITKEELSDMHEAGVRGVRFNFVKRLVDATPKSVFLEIAAKIQDFGWSTVVYFEAQDLEDLEPFLQELPGTIVIDHMGRPDVKNGVDHIDFNAGRIEVRFEEGRRVVYKKKELVDLTLSYCTSIHKVQGSEFPCVIVILNKAHFNMLKRNLLYTAITRGKKLVICLGDPTAFNMAITNLEGKKRFTGLSRRLNYWSNYDPFGGNEIQLEEEPEEVWPLELELQD